MEGREAMASYYMQRGMVGTGVMPTPPGFRPLSNTGLPMHSNFGDNSAGSAIPVESPASGQTKLSVSGGVPPAGEPVKRKRGRPRKYASDGSDPRASSPRLPVALVSSASEPTQKRGRGRPPGSGSKQQLASLGEWLLGSAGMNFTPHLITIEVGEDIASKIMSFSQQGPRAICILSANGSISTAALRQPASTGGIVTYEGRFEILSLSGSYLLTDNSGSRSRSGGLSVSLSSPDGRVIGGGVGGMLIAASPVQVIAGSFIFSSAKLKSKSGTSFESSIEYDHPIGDEKLGAPTSGPSSQIPTMNRIGWPSSRSMDLDLTCG